MTTLENLRKPDGFIALTDLFLERVRLNNLLDRIDCVDALEEIDNIIDDIRWAEQNFDDSITEGDI